MFRFLYISKPRFTMLREYFKLSPGLPSPVPPSEPPSRVLRGPYGGGEVGSLCDNPPAQQQVLRGGPAGWDDPPHTQFPAMDIRMKKPPGAQDQMSGHTMVVLLNKYCHQKPAGLFTLPKFSSSNFCPFCNCGHTCLGKFCKGRQAATVTGQKQKSSSSPGSLIPGLAASDSSSSTVLTTVTITKNKKIKVGSPWSLKSSIFSPSSLNKNPDVNPSSSDNQTKEDKVKKEPVPVKFAKSWYNKSLKKKLCDILLKSSLKSTKTQNRKNSSGTMGVKNSLTRKLEVSELSCVKLPPKPSSLASASLKSSAPISASQSSVPLPASGTTVPLCASEAPTLLSASETSVLHSASVTPAPSSFNYDQILDYLTTEWEKVVDASDVENHSYLASPELLRMSPTSSTRKRKQSPSPERPGTPSKVPGSSTPRVRTPRKDTPKKRSKRLQCSNRNRGCHDYFANKDSKVKHEANHCKFRSAEAEVSMDNEFHIPSHLDLQLDPLQCRACQKLYKDEKSRIRHERDKHRFFQHLGRTVSPSQFPSSPDLLRSDRPQSCPPPDCSDTFMTPKRPVRRRTLSRTNPSPLSSACSSPLSSPRLCLTPSSSQDSSFILSEKEYNENQNILECSSCLFTFKNIQNLNRHKCNFRPDIHFLQIQDISPLVLSLPKDWEKTLSIVSQLCKEDIVELCLLQNWCLPGYYPFIFPHQFRSGHLGLPPILEKMTANKQSSELLKRMVAKHGTFNLPKYIFLQCGDNRTSYLTSSVLIPTTEFSFTEFPESFLVSRKVLPDVDKTIDDEILTCHLGPGCDQEEEDDWSDFLEDDESGQDGEGNSEEADDFDNDGNVRREGTYGGGGDDGDDEGDDGDDDGGADGDDDGGEEGEGDDSDNNCDENFGDESEENSNENNNLSQDLLNLLPDDFQPGSDGLGACSIQQLRAACYFRQPWKYSDSDIQNFLRMTKRQFFDLILTCVGAEHRASSLIIFAQGFLMQYKLCHNLSFRQIGTLFGLTTHKVARDIFDRQLTNQYLTNCNIPAIIFNGQPNQPEIDKLLREAFFRTPMFFRVLVKDFLDPTGRNRTPVIFNIDGTYIDIEGSADLEMNKHMFYAPRSGHTAKWINFTCMAPKFVGVLPIASSQTPSSGDGLLLSTHLQLEDNQQGAAQYIRTMLRGNDRYFVILVCDAGFVVEVPNRPAEARVPNFIDLDTVCSQEGCFLLHTSNKHKRYHLSKNSDGKVEKVPWTCGNPSLDENVVKFTRILRKPQEQIHAALKQKSKILDQRHLWNGSLLPFNNRKLRLLGLPQEYRNIPKLNIIATVCCSLLNSHHPGFHPRYMSGPQEIRAANLFIKRMFVKNPLLHNIWPIDFTKTRGSGAEWRELTFGSLETNDIVDFPKLDEGSINPIALELTSGPHSIIRGNQVLTYMGQLLLKGRNLTREETIRELENFPNGWKLNYTEIKAPDDFQPSSDQPRWIPTWWDEDSFGPWHDLKLVKCKVGFLFLLGQT